MNTKTSLIATAASLALFSAANGQVVIDITGSTAGRSLAHTAIANAITGETISWYTTDGRTTTAGSADGVIYKGGTILVGGTPTAVTVRSFWAGSATGVDYVSNQVQLDNRFFATGFTPTGAQIVGDTASLTTAGALAPASAQTVAEFGFSDVKQASTIYQTNPLAEQTDMFVIPFQWLRTADLTGVSNITNQAARAHFTGIGEVPKSLYTGVAADTATVYACGRDEDSGTRIACFTEVGAGAFATLAQWTFTTAGSGAGVTLSAPTEVFNGGYASGGSVGAVLGGTGFNVVGYVGVSDAVTAVTNGAIALNFNGVPYSVENVKNGSYTYWSKYQLLRQQTLTGVTLSLFNTIKTALTTTATTGNGSLIKLSDMKVDRQSDGADVLPN